MGGVHMVTAFLRPKIAIAGTVWTRLKMVKITQNTNFIVLDPMYCMRFGTVWTEDMEPIPSSTLGCARFREFWLFFHPAGFHTSIVMQCNEKSNQGAQEFAHKSTKRAHPWDNCRAKTSSDSKFDDIKGKYFEQKTERNFSRIACTTSCPWSVSLRNLQQLCVECYRKRHLGINLLCP